MAVVIGQIITEVVVGRQAGTDGGGAGQSGQSVALTPADEDALVRRATERVLEVLRREWDR